MINLDITKPYTCRNGWKAEVTGKGTTFLTGAYIDSHERPWPMAWRMDGRIYSNRDSDYDLINVEPKREPRVAWVTYNHAHNSDPWGSAWSTKGDAINSTTITGIALRMVECTPGGKVEAALREKGLLP